MDEFLSNLAVIFLICVIVILSIYLVLLIIKLIQDIKYPDNVINMKDRDQVYFTGKIDGEEKVLRVVMDEVDLETFKRIIFELMEE